MGVGVLGGCGVCVLPWVRGGAVCAVVPWFAVLPPSFRGPCAPLLSSAASCCVVRAVVVWLVAVLPAPRASLALLSWSSCAVYRVLTLFRSFLASSSSLPLLCGLLFAFGGCPTVGASYPILYPCGRPSSLARILPCPVGVCLFPFRVFAPSWATSTALATYGVCV